MASTSIKTSNEPFIRVRLIRFSYGTQIQSLKNLKLRIDTSDIQRSKYFSILYK